MEDAHEGAKSPVVVQEPSDDRRARQGVGGFELSIAPTVEQASAMARENPPALLVVDLPRSVGAEASRRLRERLGGVDIPALFVVDAQGLEDGVDGVREDARAPARDICSPWETPPDRNHWSVWG